MVRLFPTRRSKGSPPTYAGQGTPSYVAGITDLPEPDAADVVDAVQRGEELYDRAVGIVMRDGKASTSYLQRRLSIGYNRAASLIERMEREGVIGPAAEGGRRQILLSTPRAGARGLVATRVAGGVALRLASPTILSQCWDKRWHRPNHPRSARTRGRLGEANERTNWRDLAALAVAVPLAAVGAGWQKGASLPILPARPRPGAKPVTKEASVVGEEFDKKQVELMQKVSGYFNQMGDMKGLFVQTSADNKRIRGKFYVKRPGRFRFDYDAPSQLVIISDGQYLAIQDFDLKTDDRVALDNTPFRVLLRKDVDLLRDAHILQVQDIDDVIVVALEDRNPDNPGRIKLFLAKKPNLELKEWITTDPQGLDTRVELHEVNKADDLDPDLFKPSADLSRKSYSRPRGGAIASIRIRSSEKLGKIETIRNNFVIGAAPHCKAPGHALFVAGAGDVALHR